MPRIRRFEEKRAECTASARFTAFSTISGAA